MTDERHSFQPDEITDVFFLVFFREKGCPDTYEISLRKIGTIFVTKLFDTVVIYSIEIFSKLLFLLRGDFFFFC